MQVFEIEHLLFDFFDQIDALYLMISNDYLGENLPVLLRYRSNERPFSYQSSVPERAGQAVRPVASGLFAGEKQGQGVSR